MLMEIIESNGISQIIQSISPLIVAVAVVAVREMGSIKKITELTSQNKKEHGEIFEKITSLQYEMSDSKARLNIYIDNESFYNAICMTAVEASKYLTDKTPQIYLHRYAEIINNYSRDVLGSKISNIGLQQIIIRVEIIKEIINDICITIFGAEQAVPYVEQNNMIIDKYCAELGEIMDDIVNDKKKRFRTTTMRLMEMASVNIVNEYNSRKYEEKYGDIDG
jgi:hypothetical protein